MSLRAIKISSIILTVVGLFVLIIPTIIALLLCVIKSSPFYDANSGYGCFGIGWMWVGGSVLSILIFLLSLIAFFYYNQKNPLVKGTYRFWMRYLLPLIILSTIVALIYAFNS